MKNKKLLIILLILGGIIIADKLHLTLEAYQTYTQVQTQAQQQIQNYTGTDWYNKYWSKYPDAIQALKTAGYDIDNPINKLTLMKLAPDGSTAFTPQFLNDMHIANDSYAVLVKINKYYLPTEIHAHLYTDGKTYTIRSIKAFVNIDLTFTHNEIQITNNWIILKFVYPFSTFLAADFSIKNIIYQQGIFISDEKLYDTTFDIRVYLKVSDKDAKADDAGILVYESKGQFLYTPIFGFFNYDLEFIPSLTPRAWSGLVITCMDSLKKLTPKYIAPQEYFTKDRIVEILKEMQTPPKIQYAQIQTMQDKTLISLNVPFYKTIESILIRQGGINYFINETTFLIYVNVNGVMLTIYSQKNNIVKLPVFTHNATLAMNLTFYGGIQMILSSKTETLLTIEDYILGEPDIIITNDKSLQFSENVTITSIKIIQNNTVLVNTTLLQNIDPITPKNTYVNYAILMEYEKDGKTHTLIVIVDSPNTQQETYYYLTFH